MPRMRYLGLTDWWPPEPGTDDEMPEPWEADPGQESQE